MIIEQAGRRVAVGADEPAARYQGGDVLSTRLTAAVMPGALAPLRMSVEILRRQGGMMSRALLGGEFQVGASGLLDLQVLVADQPLTVGAAATCPSSLATPLVPGLPRDFAPTVLTALSDLQHGAAALPAGLLRVDQAAHDEIGSSTSSFALAATMLTQVLAATLLGSDVEAAVRAAVARW
jgi:hypothetical protein